jgi:hypothetical protein
VVGWAERLGRLVCPRHHLAGVARIALVLTLQIAAGAILGGAAQALLVVVVVIGYVMPWLGLGLLDLARDVAAFNLPLRIGQLLAGIF